MFYCEQCRRAKAWPETHLRSHGACEVCGRTADCHSRLSQDLPPFPPPPEE